MPIALGFVGAAISGGLAGFGAAGGMAAAMGTALLGTLIGAAAGVGLYGLNLLMAGPGQSNMDTPAGVSFTDTGLRFDPTPNFTSSQASIPLVFGKTSVTCQIAHKRLYGDNYKKGFFFLACGEAPLDLESILIDDIPMSELANYSATPDNDKNYYIWQRDGDKSVLALNSSATLNWGATGNEYTEDVDRTSLMPGIIPGTEYQSITGPLTTLYGGGSLRCYYKFIQNKCDGNGWVRFRIENYYSPSEVYTSTPANGSWYHYTAPTGQYSTYWYESDGWLYFWLDSTVAVNGGHIDTTTEISGYFEFTNLDPNTLWRTTLEYVCRNPETQMDLVLFTFDKVAAVDTELTEEFSCWGTAYALVHLVWHESLTATPQFAAIVKGFGRESGEDEGNPALCAYMLLTDREGPYLEPYDILLDRIDPAMVDWESVQETMTFCNALQDGAGYRFNRAFGAPMEKETALKEMMAAGRFFIYCRGGIFTFRSDKHEPLTRIIDEATEIVPGSLKLNMKSWDTPNYMRVSYYDEGLGYTVQNLPIELDSEALRVKPDHIDLTGVTDQTQAYQLGLYALLARSTLKYTLSLNVRFATVLACYLGDLVQINTTHKIITGKTWRLMAIPAELPGHIYTLQLTQHDPAIYTSRIDGADEAGYVAYTPWYHIPIDAGAPSSWPGGNLGASSIINLDITGIEYWPAPSVLTRITAEWEYLASNTDYCRVEYSTDHGQTWTLIGSPMANSLVFDVTLRWGVVMVRVAAVKDSVIGAYAVVQEYVEGLGGDDAGIGAAQIGWHPIGGDTL